MLYRVRTLRIFLLKSMLYINSPLTVMYSILFWVEFFCVSAERNEIFPFRLDSFVCCNMKRITAWDTAAASEELILWSQTFGWWCCPKTLFVFYRLAFVCLLVLLYILSSITQRQTTCFEHFMLCSTINRAEKSVLQMLKTFLVN